MLRTTNRPLLAYFDAIKHLRLRQLSLILKAGYDPNLLVNARGQNGLQFLINYFGATDAHFRLQAPINKAAYLSTAKLLLDSGLDPNAVDLLSGEPIIFDAIRFNDKDIVSLLLNYADFSLRNKNGETAVMCAARFGSKQVMRMVLEHLRNLEMDGYFLRQRNRLGLSALEMARMENPDCAKVITKHLVAYGHNTGAVLARSSSHHQLLPRPLPYHMRAALAYGTRAPPAAGLLDDSELSDLESGGDLLGARPCNSTAACYKAPTTAAAFYDPKAAEFNQYLLEQRAEFHQQQQRSEQQSALGGASGARVDPQLLASSDEEEYYFGSGAPGLMRSRSCMLGPGAGGSKQAKYLGPAGGGQQQQQQPSKKQQQQQQQVEQAGGSGKQSSWESGARQPGMS